MSYIFLDESGDLGFDFTKKKTTKKDKTSCAIYEQPCGSPHIRKLLVKYYIPYFHKKIKKTVDNFKK